MRPDAPPACPVCGRPILDEAPCYPHEPDCPGVPCECDTPPTHAECCQTCQAGGHENRRLWTPDDYRVAIAELLAAESDGLMARWEFGRRLLAEREANGGKQLPHGRLDAICEATGKSRSEAQYRVQFADRYRTAEEVSNALDTLRSWSEVIDSFTNRPPSRRSPGSATRAPHRSAPSPPEGDHGDGTREA